MRVCGWRASPKADALEATGQRFVEAERAVAVEPVPDEANVTSSTAQCPDRLAGAIEQPIE
jgi:hypothetical protein